MKSIKKVIYTISYQVNNDAVEIVRLFDSRQDRQKLKIQFV